MVRPENLPAELRDNGLFCCWRYEERDGKLTKPPYNPCSGGYAQSNNPATFAPLPVALEALERGGPNGIEFEGIGVGFFAPLAAIDIDDCISDTGELSEMALDIVRTMKAYTERSPSGRGLRILFKVPEGFQYDKSRYYIHNRDLHLEIYLSGVTKKYVTVTGDALTPGMDLKECGEQLRMILERYMVRPEADRPTEMHSSSGPVAAELDDLELIELMKRGKNGARFSALWAGDTSVHGGDDSAADMDLCGIIAWYTNKDAERIDRIFRQSNLMRGKWDEMHGAATYGQITIAEAVRTTQGGYSPEEYRQRQSAKRDFEPVTVDDRWEPPIPFESVTLPGFPLEALPGPLDSFVEALAEDTQTPEEMAGTLSLGVLSTAFQSK